jgi:sulfite exporter TauE/SafE
MLAFGLGTVPAMAFTGLLAGRLKAKASTPTARVAAGLGVMALGLLAVGYQIYN